MRSPVSRVAAAVIFVFAIVGVALWFHGSGATPAFADFIEPILEAKTLKYKQTTKWTRLSGNLLSLPAETRERFLEKGMTNVVMMLGADRMRTESDWPAKTVQIWDGRQGKSLCLIPDQKRATVSSDEGKPKEKNADRPHQDAAAGFRVMLLDARNKPGAKRESLGEKEIDGHRVIGVRITLPEVVMSVWGDPKTGLPARIETTPTMLPDMTQTDSDFEFNVDLNESLFSVEPPAGYEVGEFFIGQPTIDGASTTEKDLLETFREYCRLSGGRFPAMLDMMTMTGMVYAEFPEDRLQKPGAKQELAEMQTKLQRGLTFSVLLPKKADAHYAGKGVSLGAADRPIFWYRPKDAKTYRVVYADLSVRDADTAPSMPAAPPPEQDLVDTLRFCTEQSGGRFPNALELTSLLQSVVRKEYPPKVPMTTIMLKLQPGLVFANSLSPEADAHYAGRGVSLGAADRPVFWYRLKDSKTYRVIYADLSVRDVDSRPSVSAAPPEQDLIDALREYTQSVGGTFPDSLDMQAMMEKVGTELTIRELFASTNGKPDEAKRQKVEEQYNKLNEMHKHADGKGKEYEEQMHKIDEEMLDLVDWQKLAPGKEKPSPEQMRKLMDAHMQEFMKARGSKFMEAVMTITQGLTFFLTTLPPEADAHYAGKGVSLGAADKPIFWYRPKDSKTYRVIYADLSVRDADTPPDVPDAQPVSATVNAKK